MQSKSWLLPDGIDELLPAQAAQLEQLRRDVLDLYASWGYHLVMPSVVEHLDSLLTGSGADLQDQTFRFIDQLSGKQLGIRADITPQVARIDAHQLQQQGTTRLCYVGEVLRTRPDGFSASRSPIQLGAEVYGHAGPESDVEVLCLMMETLRLAGLSEVYLDLGHVGVYRALAETAQLDKDQEASLFEALQRKAKTEINALLDEFGVKGETRCHLEALADLNGDASVLSVAREQLKGASQAVSDAIEYLEQVSQRLAVCMPDASVHIDLAELRAYNYQTGVVFAAFVPGQGNEIARGGRYDHVGEKFGRARPATGFSTDLKALMALGSREAMSSQGAVVAPAEMDDELLAAIAQLRAAGRVVIRALPGETFVADEAQVTEQLEKTDAGWQLAHVKSK